MYIVAFWRRKGNLFTSRGKWLVLFMELYAKELLLFGNK